MLLNGIIKPIHLLYVPTMFCNMGCTYCYLGNLTDVKKDNQRALETLEFAVEKFIKSGYLPFNISLHGGEPTTISPEVMEKLLNFINNYYNEYEDELKRFGFKKKPVHIKTNLFNFDRLYDLFDRYSVSISGSVDLPLRLHAKYRVDKKGNSTLEKIINNLKLLAKYPHNKKISCVVVKEHLDNIDEFIKDIWYIHNEIGLDMTKFNVMFGFDSKESIKKHKKDDNSRMLTDEEQVIFYKTLKKAFKNTELEKGLEKYWFEEFTPAFCCSAINCGSKFFLLQSDGEVYSCPRGQSSPKFRYGNIFKDDVKEIVKNGFSIIQKNENEMAIDDECLECEYLKYCNVGCTFVRSETGLTKSYTCKLQKTIYKENPELYPPMSADELKSYAKYLLMENNIKKFKDYTTEKRFNITPELYENKNSLEEIIKKDKILTRLYDENNFVLIINGEEVPLKSQILKTEHDVFIISPDDEVKVKIHKKVFEINVGDKDNNYLLIMCLNNDKVIYGDEEREKQAHLFDYCLYKDQLERYFEIKEDYYIYDLMPLLKFNSFLFKTNVANNIFFTTKKMREYHYLKHKENAFYHIQAINLPFSNFEFYWVGQ